MIVTGNFKNTNWYQRSSSYDFTAWSLDNDVSALFAFDNGKSYVFISVCLSVCVRVRVCVCLYVSVCVSVWV